MLRSGILILFLASLALSQTREDRWRQDIQSVQDEILRRHPNPFTKTTRAEFTEAFRQLTESVAQKSDYAVGAGISRIVASIGDAHTSLPATQGGARFLPLRVRWFPEGLYVVATSENTPRLLGKKVIRIGSKTAEEAYRLVRPYISHENDSWARLNSQNPLVSPELLETAGVIDSPNTVTYVLEDQNGETIEAALQVTNATLVSAPYLSRPRNPLYRRNPSQIYWYEYLPDSKTLYIQYNQCRETPLLPMAQFAAEVVETATTNPVDRLVIDLRSNTGGNSAVINPLLEAFAQAFFAGKLFPRSGFYTLIGRQTFSSGVLNALTFRENGSVLVGESTGGDAGGFGEVLPFQLPNSRLAYQISTKDFSKVLPPGPQVPQVTVDLTAAAFFADRDPVLDKALELAMPLVLPGLNAR